QYHEPDADILEQVVQGVLLAAFSGCRGPLASLRSSSPELSCQNEYFSLSRPLRPARPRRASPNNDNLSKLPAISAILALSDKIDLTAAIARRLWLADMDLREMLLHRTYEFLESLALKRFDGQITAGLQPFLRKFERQLTQVDRTRLICRRDTRKVGGKVRNDKIHRTTCKRRLDGGQSLVGAKVGLDERDATTVLPRQNIARPDARGGAQPLVQHLRPASRRRTEIDDAHSRA